MKKVHLFWILPIIFIVGLIMGTYITAIYISEMAENYPIVNCILNADDMLNVENNNLKITPESQREALQWGCAKKTVDFNITDMTELFVLDDE